MTASWLMLERYAMGDLSAEDRRQVEDELLHDAEAQRRLELIRGDRRAPPPLVLGTDSGLPLPDAPRARPGRWPWWSAGTLLAAAAALWMLRVPAEPDLVGKGGELVLTLQTQHAGPLEDGAEVEVGTILQASVTWLVPAHARLEADGARLWEGPIPAGNRRAVPGGWAVGEGPVELCVLIDEHRACRTVVGVPPDAP